MPTNSLFPQPTPGGGSAAALGVAAAQGGVTAAGAVHLNTASSSLSLNSLEMELGGGGGVLAHPGGGLNGAAAAPGHARPSNGLLSSSGGGGGAPGDDLSNGHAAAANSRTVQLAMELALLQQGGTGGNGSSAFGGDVSPSGGPHSHLHPHGGHHHPGLTATTSLGPHLPSSSSATNPDNPLLHPYGGVPGGSISACGGAGGSLEDLKTRRSQNMTECVPVPTSEHVAEIVGRQGCKIKALRAKTNTYIKTPVRGEEPVFVVTGRKEDVALAKREILSAADHFSQIRASRSKNSQGINSTLAFGQMVANQPGQTTTQVRVPYRVVGLVVGPKGATIKRIQQSTHTYIVTPSRDKEPVFEVTGLPENVDAARKEIEAHIAMRTGADGGNGGPGMGPNGTSSNGGGPNGIGNIYGIGEHPLNHINSSRGDSGGGGFSSAFSSSSMDHLNGGGGSKYNSILNGHGDGGYGSKSDALAMHNLGTSHWGEPDGGPGPNHHNPLTGSRSGGPGLTAWSSNGGTDDVMRQHLGGGRGGRAPSPPGSSSFESNGRHVPTHAELTGTGIWGEININKMLGGLDLNGDSSDSHSTSSGVGPAVNGGGNNNPLMISLMNSGGGGGSSVMNGDSAAKSAFLSVGSRSSLDLGSLGRQQQQQQQQSHLQQQPGSNIAAAVSAAAAASGSNSLDFGSSCSSSTASSSNHTATTGTPPNLLESSPPVSLPPFGVGAGPLLHRASVSSEPSSGFGFNDDGASSSGGSGGGNNQHKREGSLDLSASASAAVMMAAAAAAAASAAGIGNNVVKTKEATNSTNEGIDVGGMQNNMPHPVSNNNSSSNPHSNSSSCEGINADQDFLSFAK